MQRSGDSTLIRGHTVERSALKIAASQRKQASSKARLWFMSSFCSCQATVQVSPELNISSRLAGPSFSLTIEVYAVATRSRYVGFGGTYSIEQSCSACQAGPLSCLNHPHPRAPCATLAIQPLQAPERLARPEHLVELDVRCDCERMRTLIENRSTSFDAQ